MVFSVSHRVRDTGICLAIAANALCAGGVYSFPLISPALVEHLGFTQPQITTIALAGMVGQYPFAALVGKVLDARGPRLCSLIASMLFSIGFGLFSREIANAPEHTNEPDTAVFRRLVLYFGMIGMATVFSYFSVVFAATQHFPRFNGLASGTSLALFGSSPLVLSLIASHCFNTDPSGTNVAHFLAFLSIITGTTHIYGFLVLPGRDCTITSTSLEAVPVRIAGTNTESDDCDGSGIPNNAHEDESSTLLTQGKNAPAVEEDGVLVPEPQHGSTLDLLRDGYFWILTVVITIVVGSCEMMMANLASVFFSLPYDTTLAASPSIATQVQLLSIANTVSRLCIGPLADLVSPVPAYSLRTLSIEEGEDYASPAIHVYSFPRKQHISRIAFLAGATLLLIATFALLEISIRTREGLWAVSAGVGIVYGTSFTILPGILSSIWGHPNLGRNFGIISYAPFVGTSGFSYLYAYIAELNKSPSDSTCQGARCWQTTFWVAIGTLGIAECCSLVLWKQWRGRV